MQLIPLDALVQLLGDDVIGIRGPADRAITRPASLSAADADAITFSVSTGESLLAQVGGSQAGGMLCHADPVLDALERVRPTLIFVADPRLCFVRVVSSVFASSPQWGVDPTAVVHPEAKLHPHVVVGAYAVVGRCELGEGTVIHAHVVLYDGTRIGRNVVVHAGTVIGADGFGFARNPLGQFEKFPHFGGVVIEDDVEIGSNTSIDRGTLEDTVIRRGAKIDNQVHIAHNVVVGADTAVIAQAMIGGSTQLGPRAWIAPSACVRDGLTVGAGATVGLAAVVVNDVPEDGTVMGSPAVDSAIFKRRQAALRRLASGDGTG